MGKGLTMPLGKRDYGKEYREYHGKPDQLKRRAGRNAARRSMTKRRGLAAMRGKDVNHKDGNTMNNAASNLNLESKSVNRGRK
jgi:hypothetical protein